MDIKTECKLFVGGLPLQATDRDLRQAFEDYFPVIRSKIEFSKHLKASRGFGYVTVYDSHACQPILHTDVRVLGVKVDVKMAFNKYIKTPQLTCNSLTYSECVKSYPTTKEASPFFASQDRKSVV